MFLRRGKQILRKRLKTGLSFGDLSCSSSSHSYNTRLNRSIAPQPSLFYFAYILYFIKILSIPLQFFFDK